MSFVLFIEVLIFGVILSADSFSAAVAMGCRPFTRKDALRFAAASGGAEALIALVGYLAGTHILQHISAFDHWIAFAILTAVALHMAYEAFAELRFPSSQEAEPLKFHSFKKVLIVSFATSLDALGVGISLGVSNKLVAPYLVSIGIFAFSATIVGLFLARQLSKKLGPLFTLMGAAVLLYMATEMLKI